MQQIEKVIDFIVEIEKLKAVKRKCRVIGLDRYENSAEHSWQICLAALMLKEFANEPIDINRVIIMLLLHDLGEIDAGDTIIYASETEQIKQQEASGVKRLLEMLPPPQMAEYLPYWQEFEAGESAEAKFARAIDRVPPLLQNLHGEGHSWRENNISKEQIFSVNSRIAKGSQPLWQVIQAKLEQAVADGMLK